MKTKLLLFAAAIVLVAIMLRFSGGSLFANGDVEHANVAFDVALDGTQVVFSSAQGDLYLLDLKTQAVTRLTHTPAIESTPTFAPNGRSVAYAASDSEGGAKHLFLRSLDGKTVTQLTSDKNAFDWMPSFSRDGSWIAFVRASRHRPYSMGGWTWDSWDVCVIRSDGTGFRRLTRQKYSQAGWPRYFRDGKTIVYNADTEISASLGGSGDVLVTRLFTVGASGTDMPQALTPGNRPAVDPPNDFVEFGSEASVSPDGRRIAFLSDRAKAFSFDLFVMNADGTRPRPLSITGISTYNQTPIFTDGGSGLLFLAGTEKNFGSRPIFSLWRVDADGRNPHQIADSGMFTAPDRWKSR